MYRDDATALDEHDRAVGAILIGETMVSQCERAASQIIGAHHASESERWRAMRQAQDDYVEIWRQLDRAKKLLEARGANTMGYEELRPHVRPAFATADGDLAKAVDIDVLDDVRRAIEQLKLAVPGADWKAIHKRTDELAVQPQLRRRHRLVTTGIVAGVLASVSAFMWPMEQAAYVDPDDEIRAAVRQEIADLAIERKAKIEAAATAAFAGDGCNRMEAVDYVKLLATDGQRDAANAFADSYTIRCGEDGAIRTWAKVRAKPLPVARTSARRQPRVDSVSGASVRRERSEARAADVAKVSLRLP